MRWGVTAEPLLTWCSGCSQGACPGTQVPSKQMGLKDLWRRRATAALDSTIKGDIAQGPESREAEKQGEEPIGFKKGVSVLKSPLPPHRPNFLIQYPFGDTSLELVYQSHPPWWALTACVRPFNPKMLWESCSKSRSLSHCLELANALRGKVVPSVRLISVRLPSFWHLSFPHPRCTGSSPLPQKIFPHILFNYSSS